MPDSMAEVTAPEELAKALVQWERFDRNAAWLQAHGQEIYPCYRGIASVLQARSCSSRMRPKQPVL